MVLLISRTRKGSYGCQIFVSHSQKQILKDNSLFKNILHFIVSRVCVQNDYWLLLSLYQLSLMEVELVYIFRVYNVDLRAVKKINIV